jgi:intracellular multiplication protein IcmG
MANDHKKDGSFEDTDFEDLDPIEDDDLGDITTDDSFADDAWEDDESREISDDHTPEGDDDIAVNDIPAAREKTFVQKNFAVIVGAVVVIFGGVIGLSMMGGNSAPPAAESETADALPATPAENSAEFSDSGEMPPMPAPINSETETIPSQDGALTPMPMPGQADDTQLAALTIDEVPAAPAGKTTPEGQAPFDFSTRQDNETLEETSPEPQLPPVGEAETKELTPAQKASSMMNARFRERAGLVSESVGNKERAQLAEEKETPRESEEQIVPPAPQAIPQSAPSAELAALQEQLNTQRMQYEKSNQDLQAALEKKNQEIAALQKSIKTLETDLSTARAEAKSAKTAAPAVIPEPESAEQEASSENVDDSDAATIAESFSSPVADAKPVSVAEPKELIPASSPPVRSVSWELKGASPGKAVLSSKTSGDTRNVVVGDTVQGLGKITMIAREDGRWTVRGTQGQVVR